MVQFIFVDVIVNIVSGFFYFSLFKVVEEYKKLGKEFLKRVYESTTYLEEISGISELLQAKELGEVCY